MNYLISDSKVGIRNLIPLNTVQRASSKLVWVGGVGGTFIDNRASLSATATVVGLPTGSELGKSWQKFAKVCKCLKKFVKVFKSF